MPDAPSLVHNAILRVLSEIPVSRERRDEHPAARARTIAKTAALRTAAVSGSLSLPPGLWGWLTIIPDLKAVWRIQSQMVADIAGTFGQESAVSREQMFYCLFRHAAAHSVGALAVRAGERFFVRRAEAAAIESAVERIGVPIARRVAGRGLSRWLPVVGAAGVASYAYYDTMRVAKTSIELFQPAMVTAAE